MNPLEARTRALETLMRLCKSDEDQIRLEAATTLLIHADPDPFRVEELLDQLQDDE